jgi:glycosyltransferase involved in cell wall biosynthesis
VKAVLICAPGADIGEFGSMGRFLRQVAAALDERGCRPIILGAREFEAARDNETVLKLLDRLRLPWLLIYWLHAYQVWVAAGRPVIAVISQEYVLPFGFRAQIPIYHDLIQYFFPRNRKSALYYRFYLPWVTRRLGFVYCITHATGRMVERIVGKVKYRVCGVPIDRHFILPSPGHRANERYRFVWVGTLARHKNYEHALECLAESADAGNRLAMVVPEAEAERLKAEVLARGLARSVRVFSGLTEEALAVVYLCSDFVLSTSKLEGFCMPVLEAALCGCRPVVPNRAAFRENYGCFAVLVPPHATGRDARVQRLHADRAADRHAVAAEARKIHESVRNRMGAAMDEITSAVAAGCKNDVFYECG